MNGRMALACAAAAVAMAGCSIYKPGGSGFSDDTFTYYSLAHMPVTVTLVDSRTGQTLWTYEVPVGRQLTLRFEEAYAPENKLTPALLRWQELKQGTSFGTLESTMLVPDKYSRRLEPVYRSQPEMPQGVSASAEPAN